MSTTTEPRFQRQTTRGRELPLESPLPPTLAKIRQVKARAQQHREVARTLAELRTKAVEAERALAKAKVDQEAKAEQAVLAGRKPPRAQGVASAERRVEETEAELRAFESALPKSADNLLAVALPHVEEALALATEAQERALARAQEHQVALDAQLERAERLTAEKNWLRGVRGQHRVEPFRELVSNSDIRRVRTAVGSAFGEFAARREEREAEAARWDQYEREEVAEREKHAQKAAADSAAQRVVYEGMKLVEKGGRPWPPPSE